jgi:sugar/nucleoside kinase (ribokinase family)
MDSFSYLTAFEYRTPKLRLDHNSLPDSHVHSRSFHLICSPKRCIELVTRIKRRREERGGPVEKAIFIWEPVPDLCIPEEFENCLEALNEVDVVSPNHNELGGFLGKSLVDSAGDVDFEAVRSASSDLKGSAAVVVRAGKAGCYVSSYGIEKWYPSFFNEDNGRSVVDPTGGGNSFLGGFGVGLVRASSRNTRIRLEEAAVQGSVAASFAIEQVGIPILRTTKEGEMWNDTKVQDRLEEYRRRLETYIQPFMLENSQGKRLV